MERGNTGQWSSRGCTLYKVPQVRCGACQLTVSYHINGFLVNVSLQTLDDQHPIPPAGPGHPIFQVNYSKLTLH